MTGEATAVEVTSERQMLKYRVSRVIKQTQNDVVLVIRRERKKKRLLLWIEPGPNGWNTWALAARSTLKFFI